MMRAIVRAPEECKYAEMTMSKGSPGKMSTTLVNVEKMALIHVLPIVGSTPIRRLRPVAMMPTAKPTPKEFLVPEINCEKMSCPCKVVPRRCCQLGASEGAKIVAVGLYGLNIGANNATKTMKAKINKPQRALRFAHSSLTMLFRLFDGTTAPLIRVAAGDTFIKSFSFPNSRVQEPIGQINEVIC
jgi:hypothetical protein